MVLLEIFKFSEIKPYIISKTVKCFSKPKVTSRILKTTLKKSNLITIFRGFKTASDVNRYSFGVSGTWENVSENFEKI